MYTSTLLLALLPAAFAQYGDGGNQPSPTTTAKGAAATTSSTSSSASPSSTITTITVGNGVVASGGLAFSPNSTTVSPGSQVEFQFYGTGVNLTHSVVQASFADPCQPMANETGFFSGGFTTTGTGPNSTVFVITVNDTTPIWFFCGFPGHCELGMVGVINPPSSGGNTLEAFAAAAKTVNATVATTGVRGGIVEDASKVSSAPSTTSSSPAASSSKAGAAVEARGSIQWGLLVLTGLVAAGFGGLII